MRLRVPADRPEGPARLGPDGCSRARLGGSDGVGRGACEAGDGIPARDGGRPALGSRAAGLRGSGRQAGRTGPVGAGRPQSRALGRLGWSRTRSLRGGRRNPRARRRTAGLGVPCGRAASAKSDDTEAWPHLQESGLSRKTQNESTVGRVAQVYIILLSEVADLCPTHLLLITRIM
jgi:hypothetical protein